jgi:predicted metal-dependent peptidase
MDLLMPGTISETVGDIVVAIDTSGSIGNEELSAFMGEVTNICNQVKPSRVHVMYWDTEVCRHEVYLQDELDSLAKSTKPAGGGGTMVECVPAYIAEKALNVECVVVLTDGYLGGSWGTWSHPVLWAINGNKRAVASVGKTVHID